MRGETSGPVWLPGRARCRSGSRRRAGELGDHRVRDRLLDDQARPGRAHLPGVQEDGGERVVDDGLEPLTVERIGEHDVRVLPAQLHGDPLHGRRRRPDDRLPGGEAAGEADHVHSPVLGKRRTDRRPGAEQDVDHARRDARLLGEAHEQHGRQRRDLAGLDDAGAPGGERGRELPRQLQQGVVPRRDQHAHPDRLVRDPGEHVRLPTSTSGPPGRGEVRVVAEHGRHVVDVDAALDERLTCVERLDAGEVLLVALEQVRDAAQDPGPLRDRGGPPAAGIVERGAGGGDRRLDVVGTGLVHGLDHTRVERVEHVCGPAGAGGPFPVHEQVRHGVIVSKSHARSGGRAALFPIASFP
jgi:hypothetical protein